MNDEEIRNYSMFNKMLVFFNGNDDRTIEWFNSHNTHLPREASPVEMIKAGMTKELNRWIEECLSGFKI